MRDAHLQGSESRFGVVCGKCGSGDIHMLACPEHEWCVGSICHGCQNVYVVGEGTCKDCGWPRV